VESDEVEKIGEREVRCQFMIQLPLRPQPELH